jgi:hypothetical protein
MAITVNTEPTAIDNRSEWNVTTSLTEGASYQNIRIKVEIQNTDGSTNYDVQYIPKGISDYDFTDLLYRLITYDSAELDDILMQTTNSNSYFEYQIKFTEVYENSSNVTTTGATSTSSDKQIFKIKTTDLDLYKFGNGYSKFLTNRQSFRLSKNKNLITSWSSYLSTYDTFIETGGDILFAFKSAASLSLAKSNAITFETGRKYTIVFYANIITGSGLELLVMEANPTSVNQSIIKPIDIVAGLNVLELVINQTGQYHLYINNAGILRYSINGVYMSIGLPTPLQVAQLSETADMWLTCDPGDGSEFCFPDSSLVGANLVTGWTFGSFISQTSYNNVVVAGVISGASQYTTSNAFSMSQYEALYIRCNLKVNTGANEIRIELRRGTTLDDTFTLTEGLNQFSLIAQNASATMYLRVVSAAATACNFSLEFYAVRVDHTYTKNRGIWPIWFFLIKPDYENVVIRMGAESSLLLQELKSLAYNVDVSDQCYPYPITLEWLNDKGGIDAYTFNGDYNESKETDRIIYTYDQGMRKICEVFERNVITVFSLYEPPAESAALAGIITSTNVWYIDGATRRDVFVRADSVVIKQRRDRIQMSFSFDYKYEN